jgi:predicted transposase/invertase (TIGR01784 family)
LCNHVTKDILADFLTDVLVTPIEPEEITLINTELSPNYLEDKAARLDIQVRRSAFHEKMNVEIQREDEGNIERRVLFYWARSYAEELKESQDYSLLPRQISVIVVDFEVFEWKDEKKFHSVFHVREKDELATFSDALEIHVLELSKLKRRPVEFFLENLKGDECWGLYLNNLGGEEMEKIAESKPMIKRAMTIEDIFTKNEEERRLYELREKGRRDYINAINTAEKRGMKKGMEQGIGQGIELGMKKVARSMLADGMSSDLVSKLTGLSIEEVKSL